MNRTAWFGGIAALVVIDIWAAHVKHDGTLSQAARETFRTDTSLGKAAWAAGWSGLSIWLVPHVWKWPNKI